MSTRRSSQILISLLIAACGFGLVLPESSASEHHKQWDKSSADIQIEDETSLTQGTLAATVLNFSGSGNLGLSPTASFTLDSQLRSSALSIPIQVTPLLGQSFKLAGLFANVGLGYRILGHQKIRRTLKIDHVTLASSRQVSETTLTLKGTYEFLILLATSNSVILSGPGAALTLKTNWFFPMSCELSYTSLSAGTLTLNQLGFSVGYLFDF